MTAIITVDLGFGDSAKGATIDYLSHLHPDNVVIRYSGGPQAAHNVVQPDGRHHTFRQLGSGSFVPTSKTFLSKYMLINPTSLLFELDTLKGLHVDLNDRVYVSENAQIILPWYATATQMREVMRGNDNHGSTGEGISDARRDRLENRDVLYIRDLMSENIKEKLEQLFIQKSEELNDVMNQYSLSNKTCERLLTLMNESFTYEQIPELIADYEEFMQRVNIVPDNYLAHLAKDNTLLFEAAQGVLLDEFYGFHPYNTWTNTTTQNAEDLLSEINYNEPTKTYGLMRAYQTRHGAGPMPTQSSDLNYIQESHNQTELWAGDFRNGYLDLVLLDYALNVNPVDELVISHLDAVKEYAFVDEYDKTKQLNKPDEDLDVTNTNLLKSVKEYNLHICTNEDDFLYQIEKLLNTQIKLVSHGQTHVDRALR